MLKLIFRLSTIFIVFFLMWFGLRQINWVSIFQVEKISQKTEKKLGDIFWDIFKKTDIEIDRPNIISPIDSILNNICISNSIDRTKIKIHVLEKDEINAFALPNGHLVIFSGLILSCENEAELCGVICHEIAHIEKKHVIKKLIKEVGLSVLISITTGNNGAEVIKKAAKVLSSTAYDRSLESEADITAVEYMIKANKNPEAFANFLVKLAKTENEYIKQYSWISTHPDTDQRAKDLKEYIKNKNTKNVPLFSAEYWCQYLKKLKEVTQN